MTTHKPVHGVSPCGRLLTIKTSPPVSRAEAWGRGGRTGPSLIQPFSVSTCGRTRDISQDPTPHQALFPRTGSHLRCSVTSLDTHTGQASPPGPAVLPCAPHWLPPWPECPTTGLAPFSSHLTTGLTPCQTSACPT